MIIEPRNFNVSNFIVLSDSISKIFRYKVEKWTKKGTSSVSENIKIRRKLKKNNSRNRVN